MHCMHPIWSTINITKLNIYTQMLFLEEQIQMLFFFKKKNPSYHPYVSDEFLFFSPFLMLLWNIKIHC